MEDCSLLADKIMNQCYKRITSYAFRSSNLDFASSLEQQALLIGQVTKLILPAFGGSEYVTKTYLKESPPNSNWQFFAPAAKLFCEIFSSSKGSFARTPKMAREMGETSLYATELIMSELFIRIRDEIAIKLVAAKGASL